MSVLSLRLPESLHQAARELAQQDGVSINQLVTTALAEKIAALRTVEYLKERAERVQANDWDDVFAAIPNTSPEERDRL